MATFGYKLATYSAMGICVNGNARGSVMGRTTYHAWVTRFHGKFGKPSSGSPTATGQFGLYKASGVTVTDRVGTSDGTFSVTAVMSYGGDGAEYSDTPALPIQRFANTDYALLVRCATGSFNHGQNADGTRMAKKVTASFPDPYNADSNNAEGKMALWVTETPNTAPKLPSNVSPVEGGSVATGNPVIAFDFRDDEEALPGYTLGQGDKLKKFQVRVLNQTKTTVLRDSTVTTADGTMQANRRATWTVGGSPLGAGTYVAQATAYDLFDQPSPVKEWTFTVDTSSVVVGMNPGDVAGTDPLVIWGGVPGYMVTWDSDSGAAMANIEAKIVRRSDGTVVRGPSTAALSVADGASTTVVGAFAAFGWAALPLGVEYRYEARGQDTGANWSGYAPGPWFRPNAEPSTPTALDPPHTKAFTAIPVLSAVFADPDGPSTSLTPQIRVRASGSGGIGTSIGGLTYQGDGRWGGAPSGAIVTGLGDWEWRCRGIDAYEAGPYSGWQTFSLVAPVVIAPESPPDLATITTATPTITATVDRTVTNWRIELFDPALLLIADSGLVASSVVSYPVPAGKLRNNTTYTRRLTMTTSDGLVTVKTITFTLQYVPRGAVLGMTAEPVPGNYEPVARQYSQVLVDWEALPDVATQLLHLPLDGSLAGTDRSGPATATGTGALRWVDSDVVGVQAALVEDSTTNLVPNPLFAVNATGWTGATRTTSWAHLGPASGQIAATGANADATCSLTVPASTHTLSAIVRNPTASTRTVALRYNGADVTVTALLPSSPAGTIPAGVAIVGGSVQIPAGSVARFAGQITGTGGAAAAGVRIVDSANGESFQVGQLQVEEMSSATTACPEVDGGGTVTTGYTWAGTAHNSASSRAKARVRMSPSPAGGRSLIFRVVSGIPRIYLDNESLDLQLELGNNGAGKLLFERWDYESAEFPYDAAVLDLPPPPWTGYMEWDTVVARLYVNGAPALTLTLPDPSTADYGRLTVEGDDLTTVRDVVLLDRFLTGEEQARVLPMIEAGTATFDGLLPFAADASFGGYLVRRTPQGRPPETLAILRSRAETAYLDKIPAHAVAYTYAVSYLYLVNGVDWVEATAATDPATVVLEQGVLCDLADGGLSVPVRFWDRRTAKPNRDVELVEVATGERIAFQGLLDVDDLNLDWEALDDEHGTFSANDIAAGLRELGRVIVDSDGLPVPRALWWRDPRGRSLPVVVTDYDEDDPHEHNRMSGRLALAQVSPRTEVTG